MAYGIDVDGIRRAIEALQFDLIWFSQSIAIAATDSIRFVPT
jgi:hypothetical protein